ncbi:MAG TPA: ImmA/IrrE family metallo-endopeptidase [Blastocatellia bacterium]|nr:ImmA/IrrE family metallo-endopeptidase [Blastocatellia bacterium]
MQHLLWDNLETAVVSEENPVNAWEKDGARRALDELFTLARQYNSSQAYFKLLDFVAKFRFYSPFNAMLIHTQRPGATYVAPPHRWQRDYDRAIKTAANPIVILQPKGPVMFVFDVIDTEPLPNARPLPPEVENPFRVRHGLIKQELNLTIENAKRDGIRMLEQESGSQSAGKIQTVKPGRQVSFVAKQKPNLVAVSIPLRYEVVLNAKHSAEEKYATLVHELAHLYCGHLGTPNQKWWPDRQGLSHEVRECEAESISYLVCKRLGIDSPSEEYLAGFVQKDVPTPSISLECVMKSAGLIEQMGKAKMKVRKEEAES